MSAWHGLVPVPLGCRGHLVSTALFKKEKGSVSLNRPKYLWITQAADPAISFLLLNLAEILI